MNKDNFLQNTLKAQSKGRTLTIERLPPQVAKQAARECAQLIGSWRTKRPLPQLSPEAILYGEQNRLAALFFHLGVTGTEALRQQWEQAWWNHALDLRQRLALLAQHWPDEIPAPLAIKGGALSLSLYQDLGSRPSSDLDLLIPDPWFSPAAHRLSHRLQKSYPQSITEGVTRPHQLGFRSGPLLIELHRAPAPWGRSPLSAAGFWRRAYPHQSPSFSQPRLRLPSPIDHLLLWLINQGKSGFIGGWLDWIDLILILEPLSPSLSLERVIHRSGLMTPWCFALRTLYLAELLPTRWHQSRWTQAHWMERLIPPLWTQPTPLPPRWREQLTKLLFLPPSTRLNTGLRGLYQQLSISTHRSLSTS